jgi:hypothetical protein
MSFRLNRNLAITFLFSLALLLALAGSSSATALSPDSPRRRDHLNLNRMIKIRAPAPPVARQHASNNPAVNAAGANAAEDSSTPSTPSSTPSSPSASNTPQASSAAPASQSVASPSSSVSDPAVSHFPFTWRNLGKLIRPNRSSPLRLLRPIALRVQPVLRPPLNRQLHLPLLPPLLP